LAAGHRYSQFTDEEMLANYRLHRENQWLGALLQRYTMLLLGVGLKYLKEKTLAEDAVQQVFLKTITHLPAGPIANFKGWLYVLMRNHCLQQIRDNNIHFADSSLLPEIEAEQAPLGGLPELEHTLEEMHEAVAQLNEDQRVTITLFYLERMSYEQIITQTGYTFMQVKSFIQNGKRNLKTILLKKLGNKTNGK